MTGTFPNFLTGRHVESAIIATCVKWGEEWLAEAERQFGLAPHTLPVLAEGQFTTTSATFEKYPEDQLPAALVIAAGLAGKARREADRSFTAPVGIGIGFLVSTGHGADANRELASIYSATYCELLLRHPLEPAFDGTIVKLDEIIWEDERYGDVPGQREKVLGGSRIIFTFWVKNFRDAHGGPPDRTDPRPDPYGVPTPGLPTIQTIFRSLNDVTRRIDG